MTAGNALIIGKDLSNGFTREIHHALADASAAVPS